MMIAETLARIAAVALALYSLGGATAQTLDYEDVLWPEWDPWGENGVRQAFIAYDPEYNGGAYRMWYSAADDPYFPSALDWIGHAYSTDALDWTKTGPIEGHQEFPGYDQTGGPVVIQGPDGRHRMYHFHYYPWAGYIYNMYSDDGAVSWTDDHQVWSHTPELVDPYVGSVLFVEDRYVMYYHVVVWSEWRLAIFRAESEDGETWVNHQEVLGPGQPWEHSVARADVVQTPEGSYTMHYAAGEATSFPTYPRWEYIGRAESTDGIHWTQRTLQFAAGDLGEHVTRLSDPRYFVDLEDQAWLYFKYGLDWDNDGQPEDLRIARLSLSSVEGDLNGDGCVDHIDLGILLAYFGWGDGGDCDGDDDTDHADLGILLSNWGEGC